jgi:type III secretion system FlhB-like substrate exporter
MSASLPPSDRSGDAAPSVAVVLTYNRHKDDAPTVGASGRGAIAQRLLELASAHGVKARGCGLCRNPCDG